MPGRTSAVGRCRYGVMLRDDGFIYDDGVVARIARDRFHVTTTTGGAPRVLALMEDFLQTEWPELERLADLDHRAMGGDRRAGARRRARCWRRWSDIDIAAAALPHMSVARGMICGVPMRLFRVSFTGELGFEINVPADYGRRSGSGLAGRSARTASRRTDRGACTCCAPRRATSSSARTPTAR